MTGAESAPGHIRRRMDGARRWDEHAAARRRLCREEFATALARAFPDSYAGTAHAGQLMSFLRWCEQCPTVRPSHVANYGVMTDVAPWPMDAVGNPLPFLDNVGNQLPLSNFLAFACLGPVWSVPLVHNGARRGRVALATSTTLEYLSLFVFREDAEYGFHHAMSPMQRHHISPDGDAEPVEVPLLLGEYRSWAALVLHEANEPVAWIEKAREAQRDLGRATWHALVRLVRQVAACDPAPGKWMSVAGPDNVLPWQG
jgi:hypothetical protein